MLEIQGLTAGYSGRAILSDLQLSIQAGESVALIGPNGCGKSTLFRVIAGLLQETAGSLKLQGQNLALISADARARLGVGYLKQAKNVFTSLTVRENLLLAGQVGSNGRLLTKRLLALEEMFSLHKEASDKRAGLLSGGQRQSLALAMVLMRKPAILLLDEPIAGLSLSTGRALLTALDDLRQQEGFSILTVEHRLRQIQSYVNRVLVMREGRLVDDTTETLCMLDSTWLGSHYNDQG